MTLAYARALLSIEKVSSYYYYYYYYYYYCNVTATTTTVAAAATSCPLVKSAVNIVLTLFAVNTESKIRNSKISVTIVHKCRHTMSFMG